MPRWRWQAGLKRSELFSILTAYNQKTISIIELFRESLRFKLLDNSNAQIANSHFHPAIAFLVRIQFHFYSNNRDILQTLDFAGAGKISRRAICNDSGWFCSTKSSEQLVSMIEKLWSWHKDFSNHTWVPRENEDIKQFRLHLQAIALKAPALSYWIFVKQPNLYASPLHLDIFSVRSTLQSHIFGHRRFTFFPRDDDNIERCGLAL